MFRKLLRNGYRAVLSAGAANGNYQLALLLVVTVERNHIVDKVIEPCQKALCLLGIQHVVLNCTVKTGLWTQLDIIKRVWQTSDIKHQVCICRNPKFKAKRDAVYHKIIFSGSSLRNSS